MSLILSRDLNDELAKSVVKTEKEAELWLKVLKPQSERELEFDARN